MVMVLPYRNGDGRHDLSLDIDVTSVPSRREALVDVSRAVVGVHERAKRIPPELVAKALDNEPFEDYPRADYAWRRMCDEAGEAKDRFNVPLVSRLSHLSRPPAFEAHFTSTKRGSVQMPNQKNDT